MSKFFVVEYLRLSSRIQGRDRLCLCAHLYLQGIDPLSINSVRKWNPPWLRNQSSHAFFRASFPCTIAPVQFSKTMSSWKRSMILSRSWAFQALFHSVKICLIWSSLSIASPVTGSLLMTLWGWLHLPVKFWTIQPDCRDLISFPKDNIFKLHNPLLLTSFKFGWTGTFQFPVTALSISIRTDPFPAFLSGSFYISP